MGSQGLRTGVSAIITTWPQMSCAVNSCFLYGGFHRVCPTGISIEAFSRERMKRYDG